MTKLLGELFNSYLEVFNLQIFPQNFKKDGGPQLLAKAFGLGLNMLEAFCAVFDGKAETVARLGKLYALLVLIWIGGTACWTARIPKKEHMLGLVSLHVQAVTFWFGMVLLIARLVMEVSGPQNAANWPLFSFTGFFSLLAVTAWRSSASWRVKAPYLILLAATGSVLLNAFLASVS
jgi:hypothetical protein